MIEKNDKKNMDISAQLSKERHRLEILSNNIEEAILEAVDRRTKDLAYSYENRLYEAKKGLKEQYYQKERRFNAITTQISIILMIITIIGIICNDLFHDNIVDYLGIANELGDINYFAVAVILGLIAWTLWKASDVYSFYMAVTVSAMMVFGTLCSWLYELNTITIGVAIYLIYCIFRGLNRYDDIEKVKGTLIILLSVIGAIFVLLSADGIKNMFYR